MRPGIGQYVSCAMFYTVIPVVREVLFARMGFRLLSADLKYSKPDHLRQGYVYKKNFVHKELELTKMCPAQRVTSHVHNT